MTPEEKAKELFNKFCYEIRTEDRGDGYFTNVIQAKACALIAVDQVALILNGHHKDANTSPFIDYWKEVKQEIKKL